MHTDKDGVTADLAPLSAAEALGSGEEHEQHTQRDQVAADAGPPAYGLADDRLARAGRGLPVESDVVHGDVANSGDSDEHADHLVEVERRVERQHTADRRGAQPRRHVPEHREEDHVAQHVEHPTEALGVPIRWRRVGVAQGHPEANGVQHAAQAQQRKGVGVAHQEGGFQPPAAEVAEAKRLLDDPHLGHFLVGIPLHVPACEQNADR
mmetsp:Transcript_2713/g.9095  ORF Transcript_2713/g.9095 Transcript_2713/m.9095 type:complete len:209 (+) Transcript_2713:1686-2312(+)